MDLRSDQPFWLQDNVIDRHEYPQLVNDINADVVIVGAGIIGALVAYYLNNSGIKSVIVDKRIVGHGSTAASTALLQYEIDVQLHVLSELIGEKNATRAYEICKEAIYEIEQINHQLPEDSEFEFKESFYFTAKPSDVEILKQEFEMRKKHGFAVEFLTKPEIAGYTDIPAEAAIVSKDGAQFNSYKFTRNLLKSLVSKGIQVYTDTEVVKIKTSKESVTLKTANSQTITAKKLVFAGGYEALKYIEEDIALLVSTYAIVTEPIPDLPTWWQQHLLWNTDNPYIYARTTKQDRILIGGEDQLFINSAERDSLVAAKAEKLASILRELLPAHEFKVASAWGGTFANTRDGLAYIGEYARYQNSYFALCFGGNGTTYGVAAGKIISDLIQGKHNSDAEIFRFGR